MVSHWEERNKKFPLPFCVWINRPQRVTVKGGIRNVGQLLSLPVEGTKECRSSYLYSITSPGWIEIVVQMNHLTGWKKKKEAKWLARTLKPEAPFSSAEIGMKNAVVRTAVGVTRGFETVATTLGEEAELGFRTAVGVTRCIETVAETLGKSRNNIGQEDKVPSSQAVQNPTSP